MYAIIEIQGKQYQAIPGTRIKVDRLPQAVGSQLQIDRVLVISNEQQLVVGKPYLDDAAVTAVVEEHDRYPKIVVYTYRRRKNHHRKLGSRRRFSRLLIEAIETTKSSSSAEPIKTADAIKQIPGSDGASGDDTGAD